MNYSNFSKTLDKLFSLERHGVKLGLEHTKELLLLIGSPQKKINFIHIAGTNGKGSTSAHIESIFRTLGKKVGLYTSPHLINFNERIRINGVPISNKEIVSFLDKNWEHILKIQSTFFETTTAMALDYFKKKKVEIAIIETGLGGRLDSTNIIKPKIAVITSISMDHMEILGSSLKKIAYEKAGIIKRRVPTVTAIQEKPVLEIVSQVTSVKESELTVVKLPSEVNIKSSGTEFIYKGIFYKTALSGFHQAQNASLAIETLKILDPQIETRVIKTSFNNVKWPGRLEKLSSYIYYDVAHNVSGITKMVSFFKKVYPDKKIFGVFGLKSDKDLDLIFDILENNFSMLYIVTDRKKMLKDKFELSKKLDCRNIPNKPMESVKEGITNLKKIKINNEIGIIFGTHYIAEEVYNEFELSFDRGLI